MMPTSHNISSYRSLETDLDINSNNDSPWNTLSIDHSDIDCFNFMNQSVTDSCKYLLDDEFRTASDQIHNPSVSLLHVNVRSLPKNFDLLALTIFNLNFPFSVIGISETWLHKDNSDYYVLDNYSNVHRCREDKIGGGVSLYISSKLEYKERPDIEQCFELSGEAVFIESNRIVIGCIYKPPKSKIPDFVNHLTNALSIVSHENKKCFLMGDFNINIMDSEAQTQSFLDSLSSFCFKPMISKPTRITENSATLLDNIFTNILDREHLSGILCSDISDHFPIFSITSSRANTFLSTGKPMDTYRFINQQTISMFKMQVQNGSWDAVLRNPDPQQAYTIFLEELTKHYNYSFPIKNRSFKRESRSKPWASQAITKSLRHKNKLYKKYITNPTSLNHDKYKRYRNKLNHVIRAAKKKYYANEMVKNSKNMKALWSTIKEILNKKKSFNSFPSEFIVNDKPISDPITIACKFNEFFTEIGPILARQISQVPDNPINYMETSNSAAFTLTSATEQEIHNIISFLKNTSSGYDHFDSRLVKEVAIWIVKPLCYIFNLSFSKGIVPQELKLAKIVPIFKNDDPTVLTNYRPISILPVMSKILEKLAYNRLSSFLNNHSILYEHQYGFRKSHSTYMAISHLTEKLYKAHDMKEYSIAVFLDLSKAFDTIDHEILLLKLKYIGVSDVSLYWFTSYLKERKQYVSFKGFDSPQLDIKCGVPQGSILGPLLFLIYINDLCRVSHHLSTILFADDTSVVYSHSDLEHLLSVINNELQAFSLWFKANKLSLNIKKTNFLLFNSGKSCMGNKDVEVFIDNNSISLSSSVKFLGILIDDKLCWKPHISTISSKIARNTGILSKLRNILDKKTTLMLYYSLIYPYINYCNVIWASTHPTKLNRIYCLQKRCVRIILHANYLAHTQPLFQELSILSIYQVNFLHTAQFVFKATHNQFPSTLNSFYRRREDNHCHNTRNKARLVLPFKRTSLSKFSLHFRGAKVFNQLPLHFFDLSSNMFKNAVKRHLFTNYICTMNYSSIT